MKKVPCYAVLPKGESDWLGVSVRINKFFRVDTRMKHLVPTLKLAPLGWKVVEVRRYLPFEGCPVTAVCRGHGHEIEVPLGDIQAANEFLGLTTGKLIGKVVSLLGKPPTMDSKLAYDELADRFLEEDRKDITGAQRTKILEGILVPTGRTYAAKAADLVRRVGAIGAHQQKHVHGSGGALWVDPVFACNHEVERLLNYSLTLRSRLPNHRCRSHPTIKKVLKQWAEFLARGHLDAAATYGSLVTDLGWMSNATEFKTVADLVNKTLKKVRNKDQIVVVVRAIFTTWVGLAGAEDRQNQMRWVVTNNSSKVRKIVEEDYCLTYSTLRHVYFR